MSDNLPFEIQIEIMKRLPVKPLLQFRSVSKTWKSTIDSSHFVTHYQGQAQHLLVKHTFSYDTTYEEEREYHTYVSIVDDDTFPQHKVSPIIPEVVKMFRRTPSIIGISHGLLCLEGTAYCYADAQYDHNRYSQKGMAVLWNIPIRKAVAVVVPYARSGYRNMLGFGVCRETNDPKIVKIELIDNRLSKREVRNCVPWQVEIFTLSTGIWRSVCNNFPRKSLELCFFRSRVVIDEFMYWIATDGSCYIIISFDITREEFREINLPHPYHRDVYISKLRKSLVLLERDSAVNHFSVWMMEDGISESLTKLYTINTPDAFLKGVGEFRIDDELIHELSEDPEGFIHSALAIYEAYTKRIRKLELGFYDISIPFSMYCYMETLCLHEQPDSVVYYHGKRFIYNQRNLGELIDLKPTCQKLNFGNTT